MLVPANRSDVFSIKATSKLQLIRMNEESMSMPKKLLRKIKNSFSKENPLFELTAKWENLSRTPLALTKCLQNLDAIHFVSTKCLWVLSNKANLGTLQELKVSTVF